MGHRAELDEDRPKSPITQVLQLLSLLVVRMVASQHPNSVTEYFFWSFDEH